MITGTAVGQAIVIGILGFLFSLGIGFAMRRATTRSENIKGSLPLGIIWGVSSLLTATIDLPNTPLEPPLSTMLVVVICVVAIAGSVLFFRVMLRDGSRED